MQIVMNKPCYTIKELVESALCVTRSGMLDLHNQKASKVRVLASMMQLSNLMLTSTPQDSPVL